MSYDTRLYISLEPRPDEYTADCDTCTDEYGDVHIRITWTPRGGVPATAVGAHLDGCRTTGHITLNCGFEHALRALGLWDAMEDHRDRITAAVNIQLRHRPYAVIECPSGSARLELVPVSETIEP